MAGRETFRKIITSEELIKQINPENVKLMERFLKKNLIKKVITFQFSTSIPLKCISSCIIQPWDSYIIVAK